VQKLPPVSPKYTGSSPTPHHSAQLLPELSTGVVDGIACWQEETECGLAVEGLDGTPRRHGC